MRKPSGLARRCVAVDVRALQDDNYATKGIGQHCAYLAQALRAHAGIELLPFGDPHQRPLRPEHAELFDAPLRGLLDLSGDVFLNPSPMTADTSLMVMALRRGMRRGAVIHDFIPLRQMSATDHGEAAAAYRYRLRSLGRYDFLLANSWFTETEIRAALPKFPGEIATIHCRSRFVPTAAPSPARALNRRRLEELQSIGPYVFLAGADDPRKNIDIAIRAATDLAALGLRLVVGGGLGETSLRRLRGAYPESFELAPPLILPRLTDEELRTTYAGAALVLVASLDEGFSLPVAEAIALDRLMIASDIPAHREQILDRKLLFDADDVSSLTAAAKYALGAAAGAPRKKPRYQQFDYAAEVGLLATLVAEPKARRKAPAQAKARPLTLVGPSFDKPTGIAIYNRLLAAEFERQESAFTYVDVDALDAQGFYEWLYEHQTADLTYTMGNNDLYHSRCFVALENVPGPCIMHDSRLFEFILNREGPHKLVAMWNARHPAAPIEIATVVEWQRERRLLKYSFLEPLTAHATALHVHSKILARHIAETYGYSRVSYLPFALQMTAEEVRSVVGMRRAKSKTSGTAIHVAMLGETEPTKGCSELVFAVKMLAIMGLDANLFFVGKSEEPYRGELLDNCRRLGISDRVHFLNYVTRQTYLEEMGRADVLVQLRYSLFGQVSGPLGDAVACGAPVVTTAELAYGTGLEKFCSVVPDQFSPLHIATAIRRVIGTPSPAPRPSKINPMAGYVKALLQATAAPGA